MEKERVVWCWGKDGGLGGGRLKACGGKLVDFWFFSSWLVESQHDS
jgi:hypothetical protein